jgi:hypothetical protein
MYIGKYTQKRRICAYVCEKEKNYYKATGAKKVKK